MTINKIIKELLKERHDLDMAIAAVGELAARKRGPGRPPKLFGLGSSRGPGRPPGRTMSAAGRARVAAAQRKRWAKAKSAAT